MKIESNQDFSFVESLALNNGDFLRIEGQGNILWNATVGSAKFRITLKSDSGQSEVSTNFKTKLNDKNLIADSTLKGNKNTESSLYPWGSIPIISVAFKMFLKKSFDTRSKVWVEILDSYEPLGSHEPLGTRQILE
jgi:hypothetical protein